MLLTVLCSVFKVKETCILVVVPDLWKSIALIVKCLSHFKLDSKLISRWHLSLSDLFMCLCRVCLAPTMYFTCLFVFLSIPVSFLFCFDNFAFCTAPEKETRQNKLVRWFYKDDL